VLTTLAVVKTELRISLPDVSQDKVIERLIMVASNIVEQYCGRSFVFKEDIVERVKGYGTNFIHVSRTPIIELKEVKFLPPFSGEVVVGGEEFPAFEIYDSEGGVIYSAFRFPWSVSLKGDMVRDPLPGTERLNIEVIYDGGYVTPEMAFKDENLERTLPFDLEQAVIDLVVSMFKGRGTDKNIVSEQLMSARLQYDRSNVIPESSREVLKHYRRHGGV
jgi:hypothetical protein